MVEDPLQIPTLWYDNLRISEEAGGGHAPNPQIPGIEVKLVTQLASILLFGERRVNLWEHPKAWGMKGGAELDLTCLAILRVECRTVGPQEAAIPLLNVGIHVGGRHVSCGLNGTRPRDGHWRSGRSVSHADAESNEVEIRSLSSRVGGREPKPGRRCLTKRKRLIFLQMIRTIRMDTKKTIGIRSLRDPVRQGGRTSKTVDTDSRLSR